MNKPAETQTETEIDPPAASEPAEVALRIRYRVRFGKTGLLRWISHRDLATLWERLVRRASLKLSMTEGFHPKPRIAFPSALALGVQSLDEVVELELAEELTPAELLKRLVDDNQPGLTIRSVRKLPEGFGKAQLDRCDYIVTPPQSVDWQSVQNSIEVLLAKSSVSIDRKKKTQTFSIPDNIQVLRIAGHRDENADQTTVSSDHDRLELTIGNPDGAVLKPTDVLDLLGLADWIENGAAITRIQVHLKKEYDSTDPEHYAASGTIPSAD